LSSFQNERGTILHHEVSMSLRSSTEYEIAALSTTWFFP
jgi:hypothetical protein